MLRPVRISQEVADDFVRRIHRHHDPCAGWRYGIGAWNGTRLVGVACVGRAVAKGKEEAAVIAGIDPERVVEVNRCATDGTRNACSFLYSRAADAAAALGFDAIITYTLDAEQGASLRALGWWEERSATPGRDWNQCARGEERQQRGATPKKGNNLGPKTRWLKLLGDFSAPPQLVVPKEKRQMELISEGAA